MAISFILIPPLASCCSDIRLNIYRNDKMSGTQELVSQKDTRQLDLTKQSRIMHPCTEELHTLVNLTRLGCETPTKL